MKLLIIPCPGVVIAIKSPQDIRLFHEVSGYFLYSSHESDPAAQNIHPFKNTLSPHLKISWMSIE